MCVVLVVEDEALIRMVAVELLEDAGYSVVDFGTAAEAMAFCRDPRNDLAAVFTDINMPGDLDGLDVAALVTAIRPNAAVVVTSGRYGVKPPDLAPHVRFLPKPWTALHLIDLIRDVAPIPN